MCRLLGYVGTSVLLENFLYEPDSSLLKQAVEPQQLGMLNLAGFGLVAWDQGSHAPDVPFTYRSPQVAVFDRNLRNLARKIQTSAFVAHLRGVTYESGVEISERNVHPFHFEEHRLAVAHNGELASFLEMRFDLLEHIRPSVARRICGSTDSEWIYALIVSALANASEPLRADDIFRAIASTINTLRRVRDRLGIRQSSSVNLVACDGTNLLATRFVFDFGRYDKTPSRTDVEYLSQWYTVGRDYGLHESEWKMIGGPADADSIMVASEPLTRDVSTWIEIPEYSALVVSNAHERRAVHITALDI
jgi:glutamine amidotransferase